MVPDNSAEGATCVNALARACQLLAGEAHHWEDWPDFAAIAQRFAEVPDASSYADAVMASGLVGQFTHRLGEHIHRRAHSETCGSNCSFARSSCSVAVYVPVEWPCTWNVRPAVQRWLVEYEAVFTAAHQNDIVRRAKRRLRACPHAVTVAALAREIGCGVGVLQKRFLKETGGTLTKYRQRLRVASAIELLRSSDEKVEAIARKVGWKSKKELYKALARFAQMTPSAVRRSSPQDRIAPLGSSLGREISARTGSSSPDRSPRHRAH
jgi:AraC-like DNA-binding protein